MAQGEKPIDQLKEFASLLSLGLSLSLVVVWTSDAETELMYPVWGTRSVDPVCGPGLWDQVCGTGLWDRSVGPGLWDQGRGAVGVSRFKEDITNY